MDASVEFARKIPVWKRDPAQMVRDLFGVEPDGWQLRVLEAFPVNQRIAMQACKGPGKTCLLAWLCWNFLLTRPSPKIGAVSVSADNLADNLWPEMAKWQHVSPLLVELFDWTKTRITLRQNPENWFMSARAWPKSGDASQQAATLAGLHADYIMFVLDESSEIPDAVMATAEAGLSSCVEGHILQAGNPTMLSGPLYRAATRDRHLWFVVEITGDPDDELRSPRVSKAWARQQIEMYGADNPWVVVNVFGRFPPSSLNSLISLDECMAAVRRQPREDEYRDMPTVLGGDVARFGDDASVIVRRQGCRLWLPQTYRNIDGIEGAAHMARLWNESRADGCFIDDTGGYGSSWIDHLRQLGKTPVGVQFGGKPLSPRYVNKRAEMWFEACNWVKTVGSIPEIPELIADLTSCRYTFRGDKLLLEEKDQLKQRLGRSPDYGDALALTFAYPLDSKTTRLYKQWAGLGGAVQRDYDPWDRLDTEAYR